jgi:pimeloyl-ACP methyl ester carboxylesterase
MASLRTWRTVAGALLVLVVLATTSTTATAKATTPGHQHARYCKQVDAYRITSCAKAIVPTTPVGRQLRWVLAQLAGEAATLTEAEVRAHVSAEFLTVVMPAVALGVTNRRPALVEFLAVGEASPTIVPKARFSGWFDVGERRLLLRCTGHRSPTVVFEGGLSSDWYQLQNWLAPFTRVCSYDHPNGPWSRSDPAPTPRTARDFVADLHTLLRVAGVPGPYVLAGHSNGGLFTLLYASTYPRQVAGLVLIDAVHPATIKRRLAMLKPILSPEEWQAVRQLMITVPHRLINPEQVDIWTSERQTRKSLRRSPIRPMPLVALAHGHPDPGTPFVELEEPFWRQLQRELAHLVPGSRLVVATQSGHDIQHEQPELVLDAIHDVVLAVRAGDRMPH